MPRCWQGGTLVYNVGRIVTQSLRRGVGGEVEEVPADYEAISSPPSGG
jgi:hypothetical protein